MYAVLKQAVASQVRNNNLLDLSSYLQATNQQLSDYLHNNTRQNTKYKIDKHTKNLKTVL